MPLTLSGNVVLLGFGVHVYDDGNVLYIFVRVVDRYRRGGWVSMIEQNWRDRHVILSG